MKNKFVFVNFSLMVAVLFAMLYQSVHSYEHLLVQLSQQKCNQKHITKGIQVTHEHNDFEHCFSCEFLFSNFISSNLSVIKFSTNIVFFEDIFFYVKQINQFYNGISYSLRGPPFFKI